MKLFALLLLCFSVSCSSQKPSPPSTLTKENGYSREFVTINPEADGVYVSHFTQNEGELQNRDWQRKFPNREEAQNFVDQTFSKSVWARDTTARISTRVTTEVAGASLWTVTNQWDWSWEKKYAEWITENLTTDFFYRNGIETDCADVAYSTRWIFARIHGLPAANHLSGSNIVFSQDSMKRGWMNLNTNSKWNQDERFLTALRYLTENVYTHTLHDDSYPTKIRPGILMAGAYQLKIDEYSGHTLLISKVGGESESDAGITLLYSTVPRQLRSLMETYLWDSEQPDPNHMGLVRMRWPLKTSTGWKLVSKVDMPYYSMEQFEPSFMEGFDNWSEAVMSRVSPRVRITDRLKSGLNDLRTRLELRAQIVEEGYNVCQREDCSPESANYENYSTPSRDHQILMLILLLERYAADDSDAGVIWSEALEQNILNSHGIVMTLKEVESLWMNSQYSSDPRVSINERWGR